MAIPSLVTALGTTVLERAAEAFGAKVLRRWADHRAKHFIEQFVAEIAGGEQLDTPDADTRLNQILEDEAKSAALFDAFRHVFLSASRELGPRILAIHMAEVVAGLIDDAEVSDAVMIAASTLLDVEFEEFISYATSHGIVDAPFADSVHEVAVIKHDVVDFDSNWRSERRGTGPISLRNEVGSWAQKLQVTGLLTQEVSEEEFDYPEDSERHIDMPGTVRRVHRNIELREGTSHLLRLARRALRARQSA